MRRLTEGKDQGEGRSFLEPMQKPSRLCVFMDAAPETNCSRGNFSYVKFCRSVSTCTPPPWDFRSLGKIFSRKQFVHPSVDVWRKCNFKQKSSKMIFALVSLSARTTISLKSKINGTWVWSKILLKLCPRAQLTYLCTQNKLTILSLFHSVCKSTGKGQYAQLRFSTGKLICHVNGP